MPGRDSSGLAVGVKVNTVLHHAGDEFRVIVGGQVMCTLPLDVVLAAANEYGATPDTVPDAAVYCNCPLLTPSTAVCLGRSRERNLRPSLMRTGSMSFHRRFAPSTCN